MPYLGKTPSQATRKRYYLTASGGETSISGTMTTGGTLTFNDGEFVDVKLNGVSLVAGTDYNTSTANTIAGLSALAANDQVEIVVYDTFSVFSGDVDSNLSVGGNLSVTGTTALTGNATAAGTLDVTGAITSSAGATITTADNTAQLTLKSTDADSSVGPVLDLVRDSASPADGDAIGQIKHTADNDAGEATTYASSFVTLRDASDGAEDGQVINYLITGGSLVDHLRMGRGSAGGQSEVTVNEGGADIDFRVESDNDANAFFVQGSDGSTGVGLNNPSGQLHVKSEASEIVTFVEANAGSYTGEILYVQTTRTANTTHRYFKANENGGAATSIQILGNGNVQNANNSYGSTSDQRIKQDVTDANSQWDDIKALSFKNYKEKYRVSVDGDDAPVLLGLIAQDLEAAGMNGLIEHLEPDTYQKDTLGIADDVKAIKYSVLYMKAVKALQEAMTRIETLETKVAALEAGE